MAERSPLVSIGMPVRNGEKYLAEALDSFLAQTFSDFELIVSDNGSTDATAEICRCYAARDCRIRYHRAEENRGAAWNFNHVFGLSRGKYFKWAAHDDVCGATFLARCVEVMQADPSVVLCHCRVGCIDAGGTPIASAALAAMSGLTPRALFDIEQTERSRILDAAEPHRRYRDVLLRTFWVFEIFGLIRASALRRTGLHRPYYGSDKTLLAELSLMGPFREIPEVLFFSRRHEAQSCALASAQERETWLDVRASRCNEWSQMLRVARGHFAVIARPEIVWRERFGCMAAAVGYTFQWTKWKALLAEFWQQPKHLPPTTLSETEKRP
ncbi:MAG TPA: glycosyltransferase family 2 protein [Thermoguttaceae bacterium]|nr:glycosyltransferase family 2 protein [Thermoguttaceae bacterium]